MPSCRYYNTRNALELRVGKRTTVQLLLHLRQCDVVWFNSDTQNHISQILSLISKNIIPGLLSETKDGTKGSKDNASSGTSKMSSKACNDQDKKRKSTRDNPKAKKGKTKQSSKDVKKNESKATYLSTMKTKYLFGQTLTVSYQVKQIQISHRAILTLSEDEHDSEYMFLKSIPHRIIVWCYPFDALNPKEPVMNSETDGFPRQEFLPLSSLFKEK